MIDITMINVATARAMAVERNDRDQRHAALAALGTQIAQGRSNAPRR